MMGALILALVMQPAALGQMLTTGVGPKPATGGGGAITLVAHGFKTGGGATPALNTAGATLLVACVLGSSAPTAPTDSLGNTWQSPAAPVGKDTSQGIGAALYYVFNPTVGGSHTFTNTYSSSALVVAAFSGTLTTSGVYDTGTSSGNTAVPGSTVQPGAITASAGELLFTCMAQQNTGTLSINSGFAILDTPAPFGTPAGDAYLLASAGSVNPTWTISSATRSIAVMAGFKHP